MIGINTLTAVEQPVYSNHIQFFYRLGKHFPNDTFAINTPRRLSIDRMRNMTAKVALEMEADYLMFIDDDVVVPIDCLQKLLAVDADIVAGWTLIRGYPFQNMFFHKDDNQGLIVDTKMYEPEGIIDVDAVGFSCALIKCSLLKKLPPPYFVTGTHNTEDIYFCVKARHFFPDTTIKVDLSITTAHGMGTEYMEPRTKAAYSKYFETCYPEAIEPEREQDRGQKYLDRIRIDD